jgi:hypothetical protein
MFCSLFQAEIIIMFIKMEEPKDFVTWLQVAKVMALPSSVGGEWSLPSSLPPHPPLFHLTPSYFLFLHFIPVSTLHFLSSAFFLCSFILNQPSHSLRVSFYIIFVLPLSFTSAYLLLIPPYFTYLLLPHPFPVCSSSVLYFLLPSPSFLL